MQTKDLIIGKLYKIKSRRKNKGFEDTEELCMFLRVKNEKVRLITLRGEYIIASIEDISVPRQEYLEILPQKFDKFVKPKLREFLNEYQKYDDVRFTPKLGFTSGYVKLNRLNRISDELKSFKMMPLNILAVENYFEIYKTLGFSFRQINEILQDFEDIDEWSSTFKKLRGFDFKDKVIAPQKYTKFKDDSLVLHHLYTNLFVKPNLKNVKSEGIDVLIRKLETKDYREEHYDSILSSLDNLKWRCVVATLPNFESL